MKYSKEKQQKESMLISYLYYYLFEYVARGGRQDKEAKCKGRRRNGKGQDKVLCKARLFR